MGHRVISLSALVALCGASGCSLIYNPSNLPDPTSDGTPGPDMTPDMAIVPVDADPTLLEITDVSPRSLLEGQGVDGSRKAVVVVTGVNIVNGATVSITAHTAGETPLITVDNAAAVVSTDGLNIAVPVTVDIDPAAGPNTVAPTIRLDVTVTQPTATDPVVKTLTERTEPAGDPVLVLTGLREHLTGPLTIDLTTPPPLFSKINATTVTFTGAGQLPTLQAVSSITIADPLSVSGNGITAGPGGGDGGGGGQGALGEVGSPGNGDGKGLPNAGGGGFGGVGLPGNGGSGGGVVGTANLHTLASPNRGSGGAGNEGPLLNAKGGDGGGGGGTIFVTAGGTLTFNTIAANGGDGVLRNNNTGGGGSGGAVLIRAGGAITSTAVGTAITATGGVGGAAGNGNGGVGRVRFDSGVKATTLTSAPLVGHRGAMLDSATPLIVRAQRPALDYHGQPGPFTYVIENALATSSRSSNNHSIPGGGSSLDLVTDVDLFRGVNRFCVFMAGATGTEAAGQNCTTIVFIP